MYHNTKKRSFTNLCSISHFILTLLIITLLIIIFLRCYCLTNRLLILCTLLSTFLTLFLFLPDWFPCLKNKVFLKKNSSKSRFILCNSYSTYLMLQIFHAVAFHIKVLLQTTAHSSAE